MTDRYDVVVVGAGIAGSALASALARAGKDVLVLEQQTTYKDKVRGETLTPWGVLEAIRLDVLDALYACGAELATAFVPYDELQSPEAAEQNSFPIGMFAPEAGGQLNVGHPEASEVLSRQAEAAGAIVVRGIRDVDVVLGARPRVRYAVDGATQEVECRLVVGADGRASTVRRQAGLELEERAAVLFGAGLLVRADTGFRERNTLGTEGDVHFLAFPRKDDLTRLYLMVDIDRQAEFTGPQRLQHFVDAFGKVTAFPAAAALAAGEVAGPAGGSPMSDSKTTTPPVVEGAVLVGDAAGWSDPLIGQGLSIAFRDARMVSELLLASDDWSPAAFNDYVTERAERMRRIAIAAHVTTAIRCTFTPEGRARRARWFNAFMTDPRMLSQVAVMLGGADSVGADAFTDEAVAATLAV